MMTLLRTWRRHGEIEVHDNLLQYIVRAAKEKNQVYTTSQLIIANTGPACCREDH